jgi:aspartyl-tRNA(Asn)/glutamyl-tRNA(Gln) amidotransferase subunit B
MTVTVPYDLALARYEPVIGLETHVELGTRTKMFCGSPVTFGAPPNSAVCPVCLGLPGSLPVVNRTAIEYTIKIGLALNCSIATWCRFARKNYFYPDMPKNFQISQYDEPLCSDGYLKIEVDGQEFTIGIERVHLEEDTGKSQHVGTTGRIHGADYSLVDYNRAGIPLVEIVTKPVAGTGALAPAVAKAYVSELRDLLRSLNVSDVRMEEGSLRCDVNTSIAPAGGAEWGTRTETKNVNSLRSVERAVRTEIERQAGVLDEGGRVIQETRHFHEDTGKTTSGRSKEEAQDYRYFPEPDLVPVAPSREWVEEIRAALPELPAARRVRLQAQWGLSDLDMTALRNADALDLVARTVEAGSAPDQARNWWLEELSRRANDAGVELGALGITPGQVAAVIALVGSGQLNNKLARQVIDGVLAGEGSPEEVVAARGLAIVTDTSVLSAAVDEAIAANPDIAAKIADGKLAAAGALVGVVMKATRGQADAASVRELILARCTANLAAVSSGPANLASGGQRSAGTTGALMALAANTERPLRTLSSHLRLSSIEA